ncbi:hypothetical protein M1615_04640 [Patescibacteria group bacterium]|nr:hypothetical protein [Patescibacteria group bacterium]MCL5010192.1 hypothetical protein [Patescibacteria group bacterium]
MDSKTKNLSQTISFIQANPQAAQARAQGWQSFVKTHPLAAAHQTIDQFLEWGQRQRIDNQTLRGLWLGKEVAEAYSFIKPQEKPLPPAPQKQNQPESESNLLKTALSAAALVGFRDQTKLMEEDKNYKRIEEAKIREWQAKNPEKGPASQEWLDYKYGSLKDEKGPPLEEKRPSPTLAGETEREFRNNNKYAGRVEKYDRERNRVYKKTEQDQTVSMTHLRIASEANARYESLKHEQGTSYEDILNKVKQKRWEEFVQKHPEKAKAYSSTHQEIALANERIRLKQEPAGQKEAIVLPLKPVETTHPGEPLPIEPKTKTWFEGALMPHPRPSEPVPAPVREQPKPEPTPAPASSFPKTPSSFQQTLGKIEASRAPQKVPHPLSAPYAGGKGGFTGAFNRGIGSGINRLNRLAAGGGRIGIPKPLSFLTNQTRKKAVSYLMRLAAANPEILIPILVVILIFIFTFSIVGFGVPGGTGTGGLPTSTPGASPTPVTSSPSPGQENASVQQTADDVMDAFKECNTLTPGYTTYKTNNCLERFLANKGYSSDQINAFNAMNKPHHNDPGCPQCIGFVADSVALATGDSNAIYRGDAGCPNDHKNILFAKNLASLPRLTICLNGAQYSFKQVANPQPGDIGAALAGTKDLSGMVSDKGHMLIVNKVDSNGTFWAIEAGWSKSGANTEDCYLSRDMFMHSIKAYVFFRPTFPETGGAPNSYASSPETSTAPPPSVNTTAFEQLMKGQGRNVSVLGDENNFINQVIKNGGALVANEKSYLQDIYETSKAENVNPLIVLTIWGVEQTFSLDTNLEFGCGAHIPGYTHGFKNQLRCTVNSLDNLMTDFKKDKGPNGTVQIQSDNGNTCVYDDSFMYAYEMYTPVCHHYDTPPNDPLRSSFMLYYKKFLGNEQ